MTLKQITCHIVVCDGCGDEFESGDCYTPHFPDGDATLDLNSCNWVEVGDQHFCEDCAAEPHAFVPDENYPDDCARCNMTAGEHTDADAEAVRRG